MASRSTIKGWLRSFLGTTSDDAAYSDAILDPILQQAADSLVTAISESNAAYLSKSQILAADSPTGHTYSFATQGVAITDFSRWLEVRYDDEEGAKLDQARLEDLGFAGASYFDIVGVDETAQLVTSIDTEAGTPLFLRWAYWPAAMADDNSVPGGIPSRFHDVIALEALFAFALGGEARRPPELSQRWMDRRAELIAHVSRRGVGPARTRLDPAKPMVW